MKVDLLQKLNQRIVLETQRIGEQKKRIQKLKREGHDTVEAEEMLDALEEALEGTMAERDRALRNVEMECLTAEPPLTDTDGPFGGIPVGARKFLDATSTDHR